MESSIVLLTASAGDRLAGAVADIAGVPITRWPENPSGVAATSQRDLVLGIDASASELPEIEVFQHINFGGASWRTNLGWGYVGDWWNDKISSMVIVRGLWRFYQHRDFKGAYWDLRGPRYIPWVEDANIPNDIISSFKCIGY